MKFKPLPKQKYLHSILDYNPETGLFTWKWRSDVAPQCNTQFVGRLAGRKQTKGYWDICIDGVRYFAHRLAWVYIYGDVLDQFTEVDHKNREKTKNKIENLRLAKKSNNGANSIGKSRQGFPKGVSKNHNRFMASIMVEGEKIYLGTFDTKEEAHAAYWESAKKYRGEFARAG